MATLLILFAILYGCSTANTADVVREYSTDNFRGYFIYPGGSASPNYTCELICDVGCRVGLDLVYNGSVRVLRDGTLFYSGSSDSPSTEKLFIVQVDNITIEYEVMEHVDPLLVVNYMSPITVQEHTTHSTSLEPTMETNATSSDATTPHPKQIGANQTTTPKQNGSGRWPLSLLAALVMLIIAVTQ